MINPFTHQYVKSYQDELLRDAEDHRPYRTIRRRGSPGLGSPAVAPGAVGDDGSLPVDLS